MILSVSARLFRINHTVHFDEISTLGCTLGIPYAGINQVGTITWKQIGIDKNIIYSRDFYYRCKLKNIYLSILYDNGSVLYFLLISIWTKILGYKILVLRIFSLFFSCLTVYVFYLVVSFLFSTKWISILSTLMFCLHPIAIASGQLARSHALAGFLSLFSTLIFLKILKNKDNDISKYVILYGLLIVSSVLSHYLVLYIFISQFIISLMFVKDFSVFKKLFYSYFISVVLFSFWLICGGLKGLEINSTVDRLFAHYAQTWKPGDNTFFIPTNLSSLSASIMQTSIKLFTITLQDYGYRISYISILLIVPISVIIIYFLKLFKRNEDIFRMCLIFVPILFYFVWNILFAYKQGYLIVFQPIYSQYIVPYVCILIAVTTYEVYKLSRFRWLAILNIIFIGYFIALPLVFKRTYNGIINYTELADKLMITKDNYPNKISCKSVNDAFYLSLGIGNKPVKLYIDTSLNVNFSKIDKDGEIINFTY